MKLFTLAQTEKQHDPNAVHDAFIAAGVPPVLAENTASESRYTFDDAISDLAIDDVIAAYVFIPKEPPVDRSVALENFQNAVDGATTLAEVKSCLMNELGVLLNQMF